MTMNGSVTSDPGPRARALAQFEAAARSTGGVSTTARLHCLAAVDALGPQPTDYELPPTAAADGHDSLIRGALRDLGSLPIGEFGSVRAAAMHGRRALAALR
ncbi:hypothetical protein ACXR2U_00995 [Jatrophihabitans sp. YIM 134969]